MRATEAEDRLIADLRERFRKVLPEPISDETINLLIAESIVGVRRWDFTIPPEREGTRECRSCKAPLVYARDGETQTWLALDPAIRVYAVMPGNAAVRIHDCLALHGSICGKKK